MTLTVLVPLDGSPRAERALPFAANLVAHGRGQIVLVHVQSSLFPGAVPAYEPATVVAALRGDGVNATSLVYCAPADRVAAVLGEAVRETAADMLVMSTHGHGGLHRTLFGSVADEVVRRVEVPVLLIAPNCDVARLGQRPRQILVPLDGSPLAETALAPAAALASTFRAEVLLVRALSPLTHTRFHNGKLVLSSADFAEVDAAWRYLAGWADRLRAEGLRASFWVPIGSAATAILATARAEGVDLIAMSTHGRGGLGRLMLGSVTDGVVREATVPVLLVRPGMALHLAPGTPPAGVDTQADTEAAGETDAEPVAMLTTTAAP